MREIFVTNFTLVRFISSVDAHVLNKMGSLGENLITNFTHVWSLSGMSSNVDFELTGCSAFLITHFTCMLHPTRLFISLFVCVHDALSSLFVDTTACMLDVGRFVFRTPDKDCAEMAALLMVLKIICVLSAGTNPTPDNI